MMSDHSMSWRIRDWPRRSSDTGDDGGRSSIYFAVVADEPTRRARRRVVVLLPSRAPLTEHPHQRSRHFPSPGIATRRLSATAPR